MELMFLTILRFLEEGFDLCDKGSYFWNGRNRGRCLGRRKLYDQQMNVEKFISSIYLHQSMKLRWTDGIKLRIVIPFELDHTTGAKEFHGEVIVVCQDWSQRFQPLHLENQIGTAKR